tara:strand:- start:497 stop:1477 length:981 start_codon:yes stop_codon:yes gene_type:complete
MADLSPKDGKNYETEVHERYVCSNGDMDGIHGMSNFQVLTQEGQCMGFYADTGQGKGGQGGRGTGKYVMNTPGMAMNVVGKGLKVREEGDTTQLPAHQTIAQRGDIFQVCENGDVVIRARNIILEANGAGNKDGQVLISANRLCDIKAPDIKEQAEKILVRATQEIDTQTNLKKEKTNFNLGFNTADIDFGANIKTMINQLNTELPKLGEKLKSIKNKGKDLIPKVEKQLQQGVEFIQSEEAQNLIGNLQQTAEGIGSQLEESGVLEDVQKEAEELQNRFKGIFNSFETSMDDFANEFEDKIDKKELKKNLEDTAKKFGKQFGGFI